MNIIKLLNESMSGTGTDVDLFNSAFKGRYCYIYNHNVYPMDPGKDDTYYHLTLIGDKYNYIQISAGDIPEGETITVVYTVPSNPQSTDPEYVKLIVPGLYASEYRKLVREGGDIEESRRDRVKLLSYEFVKNWDDKSSELDSSTEYYEKKNREVCDLNHYDIPTADLKAFRSRVAYWILQGYKNDYIDLCPSKIAMLIYYQENMVDGVIETIRMMKEKTQESSSATSSTCSCGCNISSTLNLSTTSTCDMEKEYRRMMKQYMITVFSDLDFWKDISLKYKYCIDQIIDYLRALVKSGLSPFGRNKVLDLNYCCSTASASTEEQYAEYLKELTNIADAFELILKEDWTDRASFIRASLLDFTKWYEYLQWEGGVILSTEENWE